MTPVLEARVEGRLVCSWPGYGLGTYLHSVGPSLRKHGYSSGHTALLELMRARIFWVGESLEPQARRLFIDLLVELGIPLRA